MCNRCSNIIFDTGVRNDYCQPAISSKISLSSLQSWELVFLLFLHYTKWKVMLSWKILMSLLPRENSSLKELNDEKMQFRQLCELIMKLLILSLCLGFILSNNSWYCDKLLVCLLSKRPLIAWLLWSQVLRVEQRNNSCIE